MAMVRKGFLTSFFVIFSALVICAAVADQAGAQNAKASFKKCLTCHPDIQQDMAAKGAHAPFRKFQCSRCHNPHASNYEHLVKDEIGTLCKSCHKDKKGDRGKKYTHLPVEEGACLKCHNAHLSKNPKLLVAKGEDLCFGCHAEKKILSKKNRHDPVKKGHCLRCHSPHSSDQEALVKKDLKQICTTCHSVKNKKAKKAHLDYPVQDTNCMSCHNPHGSNRSSLIKETSHEPFAQKKCTTCHNEQGSKNPLGLKGKGASICITCHASAQEDFKKINSHVHQGVFCVSCHSPHASDEDHLKKAKEVKVCLCCHEDTQGCIKDKKNEHKHPLVKEGKCSPCHRPHGSNFRLFFGADEFRVCADCHKKHVKFTHPIGKEASDPRSKRDITCITCHKLMGSPYQFALRFDRKKQLCIQCHKGY
ncbi:MAG: hypothetical protein JRJ42_04640 [Deltaproteobacteria bacterium]|nr:hypothetical protein [Deltaproteobacteria bacterium]MBW2019038.1 hypothetical protein [Deltaproteobacteria bacterium]MBW2073798.1 hypothetical protein [Deltaproteobacteria bacterium]